MLKNRTLLSRIAAAVANVAIALLLFITGIIVVLYSPWAQELLRDAIVKKFNGQSGGIAVSLEAFRLRFPLNVDTEGVVVSIAGDTLVSARSANADIALLPLLSGVVKIKNASLAQAHYKMGASDSLMYMTVAADSITLSLAGIHLSDMAISIDNGMITGGRVAMFIRPDTAPPTPPTPPTEMSVAIGRLRLDDFGYMMRLMPSIDTLSTHIKSGLLEGVAIDLYGQTVKLGNFTGCGLDARYIAPDSATIAAEKPYSAVRDAETDTVPASKPWTVEIDSIAFVRSHALYTTTGVVPNRGLDFSYIELDSLDLRIRNMYNQSTTLRLPLSFKGVERCGVDLSVSGELDIDADALTFRDVNLYTPAVTTASFSGKLGLGDMAADPNLPLALKLDGSFAPEDLSKMFPAYTMYLAPIPTADDILLDVDVSGTTGHLNIDELSLMLNHCINLNAKGYVENFMDYDAIGGHLDLKGNIINVNSFKNGLLAASTANSLSIPPMLLSGSADMSNGVINGRVKAITSDGDISLDGQWSATSEAYTANVRSFTFPIDAFMPQLGVGAVSANIFVDGRGYDPYNTDTQLEAALEISSLVYDGVEYTDIAGTASVANRVATAHLNSDNQNAELSVDITGRFGENVSSWSADIDGRHINLYALKFAAEPSSVELFANADLILGPSANDIDARLSVCDLFYSRMGGTIALSDINARLVGSNSSTNFTLDNRDLTAKFTSSSSLDSLAYRFGQAAEIIAGQIDSYMLDIDTLSKAMPKFALEIDGANSNIVNDILATSDMSVNSFRLIANNDSILSLNGYAHRFNTGSMKLDTITVNARQHRDNLMLHAALRNRSGNLDEWHKVDMYAYADSNVVNLRAHQENIKGDTGFKIGFEAKALQADSTLVLGIKPYNPTIGYQLWSVNNDNYISYHIPNGHIDANLHMQGGNSILAVYTEHTMAGDDDDGDEHEHIVHKHVHTAQEDLVVQLKDIHVSDWISFNPFAPPVTGDVDADMRLNRDGSSYVGRGSVGMSNFTYGRRNIADIRTDFDVSAGVNGAVRASADLFVDGVKTMSLSGALNDSTATSPLDMDLDMIKFPLATVNPFMPVGTASLSGMLNGSMKVSGTQKKPVINGTVDFDSTTVHLALTGTDYQFSPEQVKIESSVVKFDNYTISGCNENPLFVNGYVDVSDVDNIKLNIGLKANNMQIVNTNRASKGADVYGKGYISLDANAHGSLSHLYFNADLEVLPGTNVTYIIPEASNMLASKANVGLVKFVNFTDSLEVAKPDNTTGAMSMTLDASLKIQSGSTINVDLSTDGKNRVQMQSNGTLNFSMTPLDNGRLTGRLNLDDGFVRYTPPFMSEKYFSFDNSSYVAFTGDMMNPSLNLHATDVIKANVTQTGQNSRLVNFDVKLAVTGTLNRMDVAFDLATNDDITVANELESMTAEQRANQAMNMLLYNVYTGPGTKGYASLSGNPLFSFLESQINSWAASNIRGVDISFGINQYDRTIDGSKSSTMSYSYQVSKTLFNDRFKIVVGGNYSTDADADENFSQNLINDISFEYYLNSQRNMYLRLFRHTGFVSILEGEVTQTGVGFVYRRKLRRIGDMFLSPGQIRKREEIRAQKENEMLQSEQDNINLEQE